MRRLLIYGLTALGMAGTWHAWAVGLRNDEPAEPASGVTQYGSIRETLRDGQTEARVALVDVISGQNNFIAVGAIAGLEGEITIVGEDVWVTRVSEGAPETSGPDVVDEDKATLLTAITVPAWSTEESHTAQESLRAFIESLAHDNGLDLHSPFPFIIDADSADLSLHVINGRCPMSGAPKSPGTEPWRWSGDNVTDVRIVGVYARGQGGVMTHHGSPIHAHAIVSIDGRMLTAHIDEATLAGSISTQLPNPGNVEHTDE